MSPTVMAYVGLFNALLSLGLFGFLVHLARAIRDAERSRADWIEERLKLAQDQISHRDNQLKEHEKWADRRREELADRNKELQAQIDRLLSAKGLDLHALASGGSLHQEDRETKGKLDLLLARLEKLQLPGNPVDPEADLELAKAYMAQRDWRSAAERLDAYVRHEPDSFEVQFLRGVAWANTRQADLAALRAYSETIALIADAPDANYAARAFIYRGAMLKRLGRADEARSDLVRGLGMLNGEEGSYEALDAHYNLACVSAMLGDRDAMLEHLDALGARAEYRGAIRDHLKTYFSDFSEDPALLAYVAG